MKVNTAFIENLLKGQREEDKRLSPSRHQIKYLVSYAKAIHESAQRIELLSNLAHEGIISFEDAQMQLDWPMNKLRKDIQYLHSILEYKE